tara:strand:+ start:2807 stop:3367 length:561 start_codon:yes stop_codon:yes gene_type:complete
MNTGFHFKLKEYFWNSLKKMTNTFSNFTVTNLGNGYIKCFWDISTIDNLRIELSKSCFYAIRLFDISNNRNKNHSTCIMKEIQVSKFQSSISFPIPMNKGMYYFEFGYRKRNGDWRMLAFQNLNLGYRIKKVSKSYDDWFDSKKITGKYYSSIHEEAYQLSLYEANGGSEKINGGSEKIIDAKKNT